MTFDAITEALHERSDKELRDKINNQVDQFFDGIYMYINVLDMTVPPESILHFLTKINPYKFFSLSPKANPTKHTWAPWKPARPFTTHIIDVTNDISFKDLAEMLKNALFEAMKDAARKKEVSIFIYNIERGYIGPAREQAPITQETKYHRVNLLISKQNKKQKRFVWFLRKKWKK
jgi:hypothetical protein